MAEFQESFEGKVHNFLISNVEAFNYLTKEDPVPLELFPDSSDLYGDPLPLECLMRVPDEERRKRALKLISPGHIVRGRVVMKTQVVLGLQVTSVVGSSSSLRNLDFRGLVPVECLAVDRDEGETLLKEMEIDDVVQGVVTGCKESQLSLSFRMDDVSTYCPSGRLPNGVSLGYLKDEPPRQSGCTSSMEDFLTNLRECPGFANPSSTENLEKALGIHGYKSQTKPTLIRDMQKREYLESDFSSSLRKKQRFKWSMETVAVAVKHFKEGDLDKALGLFHHALDIDPKNVEGLVARGALYANKSRYRKAIADFETALTENGSHRNARKFLVETRIAYGERLEEDGLWEEAAESYKEAIADDGSHGVARDKLERVQELLERKAAEQLERERKEAAERARIKKLHSIIEEEKRKKDKRDVFTVQIRPGAKKEKKKKKKSKKSKRRYDSTSEGSLLCSDTDSSSELLSPSLQKRKKHRKSRDNRHSSKHGGWKRHSRKSRSHSRSPLIKDRDGSKRRSASSRQKSRKEDYTDRKTYSSSSSSEKTWRSGSSTSKKGRKPSRRNRRDSSYSSSSYSPHKKNWMRKSSSPVKTRKRSISPVERKSENRKAYSKSSHLHHSHHRHHS